MVRGCLPGLNRALYTKKALHFNPESTLTPIDEQEQQVIDRLRNGDSRAADIVVERYKRPLFAFVFRMVNDQAVAEDIFQETWLRVVRSLHRFRGDARFSTWLFQIALNLCRDWIRQKSGRTFIPFDDIEEPSCEPDVDPERMMRAEAVRQLLNELPEKMREVIILKFYHDLDDQEIATTVGCPVGTVKTRCHRAIKILSKKWELRFS